MFEQGNTGRPRESGTAGPGFPAQDNYHRFVYPMSLLARTAQIVLRRDGGTARIPADIPTLVSEVYDPARYVDDDEAWRATFEAYDDQAAQADGIRETAAANTCIPRAWETPKIDGLNLWAVDDDTMMRVVVRDGDISVEAGWEKNPWLKRSHVLSYNPTIRADSPDR